MTTRKALAETCTAPALAPTSGVPERIGKYYVVHEVGRGSTGTVYLSHDPFYGRDVAIKFYHATSGDDAESRNARRMLLSEAHMVGKLQHPNIVPIIDAGEEYGRRYVDTEHVHGARTLSAYCRPGSLLPIDHVVGIVYKCAKALHSGHSRGVVHRDIKTSNILLTQDGDVRIVDFGIALVSDSEISRLEGVAGSPAYVSPEQVQGHELDSRSDLYSLGAVMSLTKGPLQGYNFRGEFAWVHHNKNGYGARDDQVGVGIVDTYNYVLGIDKYYWTNWLFSFQFMQFWLEREKEKGYYYLLGPTSDRLDQCETILSLKIKTDFMHERLQPGVLIQWGDDNDWSINPRVEYELRDYWILAWGMNIFSGHSSQLFGQYNDRDTMYLEVKLGF